MTYNKTLLGKIRYACPSCGEVLLSKVSDVGTKDACPSCSTSYVVPGLPNLDLLFANFSELIADLK